jgi:hypothetical protein
MIHEFQQVMETNEYIALCDEHYQQVYHEAHILKPCKSCGAHPKVRNGPYTRHSPDATKISKYLKERMGEISIEPSDVICKMCYNMHTVILKSTNQGSMPPVSSDQLVSDIKMWSSEICQQQPMITKSIISTVVYVGNVLLKERAILLSRVAKYFRSVHEDSDDVELENGTVNSQTDGS